MNPEDSITHWIAELKQGNSLAAQAIWERYHGQLMALARGKLGKVANRTADEEDVVLSAFHSFYKAASGGRFPRLEDRHDLWKLLVTMTARKAFAHNKRGATQKRGGGQVRGESVFLAAEQANEQRGIEQVMGREPTPEFAAQVSEQFESLLARLEDHTLQQIALLKMQGYSHPEIAHQLNCVPRTVERKLERIRSIWADVE